MGSLRNKANKLFVFSYVAPRTDPRTHPARGQRAEATAGRVALDGTDEPDLTFAKLTSRFARMGVPVS
ncbi:MAG TPA: hypothetical protein VFL79_15190 [Terriglobia bacterium]|nr:hypothetical protein [Terriglobia bacterium]